MYTCKEVTGELLSICASRRNAVDKMLISTGIYRLQHQILLYLLHCKSDSQAEIAKALKVSEATIAVSLKKLMQGGYTEKTVDESDNRRFRVVLTEKGRCIVAESIRIFDEIDDMMYAGLSEAETESLMAVLKKIRNNLNKQTEEKKQT